MKPKARRVLLRGCFASLLLLAGVLGWFFVVTPAQKVQRASINSRGFAHIAANTQWNLKDPMLWGYYFTNDSKWPLAITRRALGLLGYRFVDLSRHDDDRVWWLHLERTEVHDLDTLSIRDVRLSRFASLSFSDYDGWDVGPPN